MSTDNLVKKFAVATGVTKARVPELGEGKRGTSGHLAYLLRQANAAVRMKLESSFAEFDITLPQFAILTMIAAYPPLSGADLARLTYLTPQTVNVIVRNLVRRGAIVKYADDVHGRILRLEITNDGRRLLKNCKRRANRIEAGLTASLSSADEMMLRGWLVRIATELQE